MKELDPEGMKDHEIAVLVNGLGGTSREELGVLYKDIRQCMEAKDVKIHLSLIHI